MEPTLGTIALRKEDHLRICSEENVNSLASNFWDQVELPPHRALPELNLAQVTTNVEFLERSCRLPLLISSMTGGSPKGDALNLVLARAAQELQIPMGVGSQRVALEERNSQMFHIRKEAPRAQLLANLGAVQLNYGVSIDDCRWLVDQLEASALILHLNPLQEAIQEEGNRDFSNLLSKISALQKALPVPLIIKEVGSGLDLDSCKLLVDAGVKYLDLAGLGGSHWGYIEGLRSGRREKLGQYFRNWGTPTPTLVKSLRQNLPQEVVLIASGGVREGLDLARAVFLGANMAAMALPFLKAAEKGDQAVAELILLQEETLKIALFCMGLTSPEALRTHG